MDNKNTKPKVASVNQEQVITTAPKAAKNAHDSNPFTTTITGIKSLLKLNTGTLVGVVLFNIVISLLLVITAVVGIAALISIAFQNGWNGQLLNSVDWQQAVAFTGQWPVAAMYITLLIGVIIIIILGALIQVVQTKLVAASAAGEHISFGDLFKQSMRRVMPLVGFTALLTAIVLAAAAVLILLGMVLGPAIFVLGAIAVFVAIYLAVRLTFAVFGIVEEGLGPIAALKRSFSLTKGHVVETIGVAAAASIFVMIPVLVLDLLAGVGGPLAYVFQILGLLVNLVAGTIAFAGIAQRYVQLRNINSGAVATTKTHFSNYLAIAGLIVVSMASSAINSQYNSDLQTPNDPYNSQELEQKIEELEQGPPYSSQLQ